MSLFKFLPLFFTKSLAASEIISIVFYKETLLNQLSLVNYQGIIIKTDFTRGDVMIAANNATLTVCNHLF